MHIADQHNNSPADKNLLEKAGKTMIVSDLGDEFGFTDIDGKYGRYLATFGYISSYIWLYMASSCCSCKVVNLKIMHFIVFSTL